MSSGRLSSPLLKQEESLPPSDEKDSKAKQPANDPNTSPMAQQGSSTPTPVPVSGQADSSQTPLTPPSNLTHGNGQEDEQQGPLAIEDEQDPEDALEEFAWDDLEQRFREMIQQRDGEDAKISEELDGLMKFFTLWSETTYSHEFERSSKRLATRIYHVQHSEDQLEQKRQHYVRVVQAFQSALQLLNGP